MFRAVLKLVPVMVFLVAIGGAVERASAQGAARTIAQDCAGDLTRFCKAITPGEGRKVACLISHSDKITPRCRLTAYMAGKALANSMLALERLAFVCGSDIDSLCHSVRPGGGRVYDCLRKNRARLLDRCRNALPKFESTFMRQ